MTPSLPDPARLAGTRLLRLQSDERLVALVRDGHEAAFSAIVYRYRGQLVRYARRIVGEPRAEDAVQQAFVNAHRALMRDSRSIQLKGWLYQVTHNAALNHLRSVRDDVALDDSTTGVAAIAAGATATDVVELRAQLRETLDAIAALPAPQRDALLLRELEGRSHEEIALALGISRGAARQQVMRARTALRSAVSALTPYPLVSHLATSMGSGSGMTRTAAEIVTGAGAGAAAIKLTAGIAATGALVTAFAAPAIHKPPTSHARPSASVSAAAETAPLATVAVGSTTGAGAEPAVAIKRRPDARRATPGRPSRSSSGDPGGSGSDRGHSGDRVADDTVHRQFDDDDGRRSGSTSHDAGPSDDDAAKPSGEPLGHDSGGSDGPELERSSSPEASTETSSPVETPEARESDSGSSDSSGSSHPDQPDPDVLEAPDDSD